MWQLTRIEKTEDHFPLSARLNSICHIDCSPALFTAYLCIRSIPGGCLMSDCVDESAIRASAAAALPIKRCDGLPGIRSPHDCYASSDDPVDTL